MVDEVEDGRCNVYARFEGTSDRAVTVDVHLDTVGVEHMEGDPFDGRIEDGRVYVDAGQLTPNPRLPLCCKF